MLRNEKDIRGFKLDAKDDELGKIKEFYFDDLIWTVRYLVADTGRWLPGRKVLLSPVSLGRISEDDKSIAVELTKDQIKDSPSIVTDRPVSRQDEVVITQYYGWPTYWEKLSREASGDPHLRSTKELSNYSVYASDGKLGKIADFVVDDMDWTVRYMVLDTKEFPSERKVLLALDWVMEIDDVEKRIRVDVPRHVIEDAPTYDPQNPINRHIEAEVFDYYKKKYYWS